MQASNWNVPATGPALPEVMAARINDDDNALLSCNSGPSAPAYVAYGALWVDTSTTPAVLKQYNGGAWIPYFQLADPPTLQKTSPGARARILVLQNNSDSVGTEAELVVAGGTVPDRGIAIRSKQTATGQFQASIATAKGAVPEDHLIVDPNGVTTVRTVAFAGTVLRSLLVQNPGNSGGTGVEAMLAASSDVDRGGAIRVTNISGIGTHKMAFALSNGDVPADRVTIDNVGNLDVLIGEIRIAGAAIFDTSGILRVKSYTVATLPTAGTANRVARASNARVLSAGGAQEGAGAGTGSLVIDNGSAWKVAGTNITAAA